MKLTCLVLAFACSVIACGDDGPEISSDEEARRAYLGLDKSIEKSITLGFAGFNAADSANIPPQMTTGVLSGMLTITGQVDQGASANKGMRLRVGMVMYSDGVIKVMEGDEEIEVDITYDTTDVVEMQPYLEMKLNAIPAPGDQTTEGTWTGTLTGDYGMSGDLDGSATLMLMFSGKIKRDAADTVIRTPGSTTVTGSATSGDGSYEVNLTI